MNKSLYKTIGIQDYNINSPSENNKVSELKSKDLIPYQLNITSNQYSYNNTSDPKVWGPPMWFTLHTFSAHYPINGASDLVKDQIRNYINAIPFFLPCRECSIHAKSFIDSIQINDKNLNNVLSSRKNLFEFFVDFHNKVNQRHNKPLMKYSDAYNIYFNVNRVNVMKYNI